MLKFVLKSGNSRTQIHVSVSREPLKVISEEIGNFVTWKDTVPYIRFGIFLQYSTENINRIIIYDYYHMNI